jgi:hypothetical protein
MAASMNVVIENSETNLLLFRRMVEDVPSEQMCRQPGGVVNHAAWQLGHVAFVRTGMVQLLGGAGDLPPEWAGLFAPGTTPSAAAEKYPPKDVLLERLARAQQRVREAVKSASPADLEKPNPIPSIRGLFPTVGHLVAGMLTTHDGMHLGQLSVWRRVQGLPRVI